MACYAILCVHWLRACMRLHANGWLHDFQYCSKKFKLNKHQKTNEKTHRKLKTTIDDFVINAGYVRRLRSW